jgi:kynureninase
LTEQAGQTGEARGRRVWRYVFQVNPTPPASAFDLADGLVYLNGNSLGPPPTGVADRMQDVLRREWGEGLIRSWNDAHWMELSTRVAARIAPLIGVSPDDLHLGDSTSVSLFKTVVAASRLRPDRRVIVVEPTTFPTDGYIVAGVADLLGLELRWCDPADPLAAVDEDVALLNLTHVDFRTGAMFDMATITAGAQARGALVQWDLCHSAGAVPVDLTTAGADLAVGCTYKYLNGGPGSPAFIWAAPRHQASIRQPITGWMGHRTPFAMARDFEPVEGIRAFASGTPPVLALSALEAALAPFEGVTVTDLRTRSLALTDAFISLVEERLPGVFEIVTPREHERRGSQVSLRHGSAYGVIQALIAREVIGDFRDPDIARFGFAPLYNTLEDVRLAIDRLELVLANDEHLDASYAERNAVT